MATLMGLFVAWASVFVMCSAEALPERVTLLIAPFMAAIYSAAAALDKYPFRSRKTHLISLAVYAVFLAAAMVCVGEITAHRFGLSLAGWY